MELSWLSCQVVTNWQSQHTSVAFCCEYSVNGEPNDGGITRHSQDWPIFSPLGSAAYKRFLPRAAGCAQIIPDRPSSRLSQCQVLLHLKHQKQHETFHEAKLGSTDDQSTSWLSRYHGKIFPEKNHKKTTKKNKKQRRSQRNNTPPSARHGPEQIPSLPLPWALANRNFCTRNPSQIPWNVLPLGGKMITNSWEVFTVRLLRGSQDSNSEKLLADENMHFTIV